MIKNKYLVKINKGYQMSLNIARKSFLLLLSTMTSHAGTSGISSISQPVSWTGLYLGANAGYLWSSGNVNTYSTQSSFNPDFFLNGEITRRSLVRAAANDLSVPLSSFLLGGQAGYSYQLYKKIIAGVTADFDWLFPSKNDANVIRPMNFVASGLDYTAEIKVNRAIDYLGTVRGKLGTLITSVIQVYGTGGYAYGQVSLKANTYVINNGFPSIFPAFSSQGSRKQTKNGWTAGGGIEWMFFKNWSATVEYLYYDLGKINVDTSLTKLVQDFDGVVPYASTDLRSTSKITANSIRVGINSHFD